jgi:hypothetical protein
MKRLLTLLIILINVLLCTQSSALTRIYIPVEIPFAEGSIIKRAILKCDLGAQLANSIVTAANKPGSSMDIIRDDAAVQAASGLVLKVVIANSTAINAGMTSGGYRDVAVSGALFKDGVEIGSFTGLRHSNYRPLTGQCSLLQKCTDTLGQDIVKWLAKPAMGSRIGE